MARFSDQHYGPDYNDPAHQIHCAQPDCEAWIRNHAWDKIKKGWFFLKNGEAFCPDHIPSWVAAWRAKKARKESSRKD